MKPSNTPPPRRHRRCQAQAQARGACSVLEFVCLFFLNPNHFPTALLYSAVDFWSAQVRQFASKKNSRQLYAATAHISLWDHVFHGPFINLVNFRHASLHKRFNA